jgi:hypothetical protein
LGYKDYFIPFESLSNEEQLKIIKNYEDKGLGFKKTVKNIKGFTLIQRREIIEQLKSSNVSNILIDQINDYFKVEANRRRVVKTISEGISLIEKINLGQMLNFQVQPRKNFNCIFVDNNIASIACDDKGIWRYFSRNQEETVRHSLGVIDIVELIFNESYFSSVEILCELSNIEVFEFKWKKNRQEMYRRNLSIIAQPNITILGEYPILYKFVKRHLYLLREIYLHGNLVLSTESISLNNMDVFFVSSRYLEKKLESKGLKRTHTSLNRLINLYVVLGLLIKVDINNLPDKLKKDAITFKIKKGREIAKDASAPKKNCHPISFYQVPTITKDLLIEAEKRVISLKVQGIKATGVSVSSKDLITAIGESEYKRLFQNRISFIKVIEEAKTVSRNLNACNMSHNKT